MTDNMPMQFTEVFSTFSPAEISFLKTLFKANHIRYVIEGENFIQVNPPKMPARIKVDQLQFEVVEDLMKDFRSVNFAGRGSRLAPGKVPAGISWFAIGEVLVALAQMTMVGVLWTMESPSAQFLSRLGYKNADDYYFQTGLFALLTTLALSGALGILARKNWARQLLILSQAALIGVYVGGIFFGAYIFSMAAVVFYLWYGWLIFYFSRRKVVQQFV